ncbi:MAG TPA: Gfo/Idh/MocA family oxidoreductase [Planctomycetota bacterium]|nr:Gfo/Idh/MocA family oxidoreductase [Planctomycetota bacterium]
MAHRIRTSRRRFLRRAAGAAGAAAAFPFAARALGAEVRPSERITIGCIGTGGHGREWNLRSLLAQPDARVLAVCDVDRNNMAAAKAMVDEKYGTKDCAAQGDFREILRRGDIDAVMISTPDHWHVLMSVMAVRAGKDVQCEKPTLTIDEGKILVKTVRAHKKVFQTSTEDRSIPVYHRMAELVRNGRIGALKTIRVTLPRQPETPGDPTPQPVPPELNWDLWLGPAPEAPYTRDRVHFNFRWIRDYSGGIICDWGTHLFDTAQWANDTELGGPVAVEGAGTFWEGGLYDTPKEYHLEYTYANGVRMIVDHGGTGIRCEGTEGWIEVPSWRAELKASDPEILKTEIRPDGVRLFTCPAGEHRNFLDCVKSRKDPYFPVDKGHRVATICHLGNLALLLKRKLAWDPEREVFIGDAEANRHLSRPMRAPWTLA